MKVLEWLMAFVVKNDVAVMISLFALLFVWGLCNVCPNVYRKQVAAMEKCRRLAIADPERIPLHVRFLPDEYRRQWRAYVRAKAEKPSLTFEFVPVKRRWQLMGLFFVMLFLSAFLFGTFVPNEGKESYVIFQIAYGNAIALTFVVAGVADARKERKARFAFGKLVAELNRHLDVKEDQKQKLDETVRKINDLKCGPVTENTLNRAAEILKNKGLEENRSAADQRKLNTALNMLLQAYARNKNKAATSGSKLPS